MGKESAIVKAQRRTPLKRESSGRLIPDVMNADNVKRSKVFLWWTKKDPKLKHMQQKITEREMGQQAESFHKLGIR